VIQVPQLKSEEALVLELLNSDGVLVHPGYFFDFPREAYLIVSLLIDPKSFDSAIERVLTRAVAS
jgi:aspartate/methionine/tyrosine aminotransferase